MNGLEGPQDVQRRSANQHPDEKVQDNRNDAGQQRTDYPGADDFAQDFGMSRFVGKDVPADDGTDNSLRGRDGEAVTRHPVETDCSGKSCHKGAGKRIDRAQLSQSFAGAGTGINGTRGDKERSNDGRGFEADHFGSDGQ